MALRLRALFEGLSELIRRHEPDEAAVEETFVSAGARSALQLGQARGVALMTPAALGLPVGEYAANLIKKSIVGAGHAEKGQIQMMVKVLLPTAVFDGADAADALAIAICHAHHRKAALLRAAG
jgi:crossover junction endodeoxyribonuclease RuvC